MISEETFNRFLIEYETIIRYATCIGILIINICVFFGLQYFFSKIIGIPKDNTKEVVLFAFSAMGMIVSIPFVGIFFIVLGTILKYIFIK